MAGFFPFMDRSAEGKKLRWRATSTNFWNLSVPCAKGYLLQISHFTWGYRQVRDKSLLKTATLLYCATALKAYLPCSNNCSNHKRKYKRKPNVPHPATRMLIKVVQTYRNIKKVKLTF